MNWHSVTCGGGEQGNLLPFLPAVVSRCWAIPLGPQVQIFSPHLSHAIAQAPTYRAGGGKALTHHCGFLSSEHRAVPESHSATELLLPAGDCCSKHSPRYYTVTAIVTGRCCLAPPHHAAGLLPCCQSAEPFGACLLAGI